MKKPKNLLLDPTYGTEGIAYPHEHVSIINKTLKTAKGLMCTGGKRIDGDNSEYALFRLDSATGALDKSFGANGLSTGLIDQQQYSVGLGLVQLDDDRFLMLGYIISDNFSIHHYLTRFDANGNLDTQFGSQGHQKIELPIQRTKSEFERNPNPHVFFSIANHGNAVYVSGTLQGRGGIIKYDADGKYDSSFGQNGFLNIAPTPLGFSQPLSLHADSDGFLVGVMTYPNGLENPAIHGVARVRHNGEFDAEFGEGGFAFINEAQETSYFTVLPDKRIILPIRANYNTKLFALDKTGKPDTTFNSPNFEPDFFHLPQIGHTNDTHEIIVIGRTSNFTHFEMHAGKFLPNGEIDKRFAENGWGFVDKINNLGDINVQPDGNTTVSGNSSGFPERGFNLRLLTK